MSYWKRVTHGNSVKCNKNVMLDNSELPFGWLLNHIHSLLIAAVATPQDQSNEVYDIVGVQGKTVLGVGDEYSPISKAVFWALFSNSWLKTHQLGASFNAPARIWCVWTLMHAMCMLVAKSLGTAIRVIVKKQWWCMSRWGEHKASTYVVYKID